MKNFHKLFLLSVACINITGCLFTPQFSDWDEGTYYEELIVFDADTILQTIVDGDVDQSTFRPNSASLDEDILIEDVVWTQNDYLILVRSLLEWRLGEKSDDWILFSIAFDAGCEFVRDLPDDSLNLPNWRGASISFYQPAVSQNGIPYREVINILVLPDADYLIWSNDYYIPKPARKDIVLPEWDEINIEEMQITAEEAYVIAENAGGSQINICRLHIFYNSEDSREGWHVSYFDTGDGRNLSFTINEQTRGYEIFEK